MCVFTLQRQVESCDMSAIRDKLAQRRSRAAAATAQRAVSLFSKHAGINEPSQDAEREFTRVLNKVGRYASISLSVRHVGAVVGKLQGNESTWPV
jgi:hypothetical protein